MHYDCRVLECPLWLWLVCVERRADLAWHGSTWAYLTQHGGGLWRILSVAATWHCFCGALGPAYPLSLAQSVCQPALGPAQPAMALEPTALSPLARWPLQSTRASVVVTGIASVCPSVWGCSWMFNCNFHHILEAPHSRLARAVLVVALSRRVVARYHSPM